jgi:hypothetical protein
MINRNSLINGLRELRISVQERKWEQSQAQLRLLVHLCDRLTQPMYPALRGSKKDRPFYVADQIGLGVPSVNILRGHIAEAGLAVTAFDSRKAASVLDDALRSLRSLDAERPPMRAN